jgi:hypothetical protein
VDGARRQQVPLGSDSHWYDLIVESRIDLVGRRILRLVRQDVIHSCAVHLRPRGDGACMERAAARSGEAARARVPGLGHARIAVVQQRLTHGAIFHGNGEGARKRNVRHRVVEVDGDLLGMHSSQAWQPRA